jgi:hypothetical protein
MESRVFKGSGMELPPLPEEDPLPIISQGGEAELVVDEHAFVTEVIAPRIAFEQSSRGVKKELDNERRVEVRDEPGPVSVATVLQDRPLPQQPLTPAAPSQPPMPPPPPLMPPTEPTLYSIPSVSPEPPRSGGMYTRAIQAGFVAALVLSAIFGFAQVLL